MAFGTTNVPGVSYHALSSVIDALICGSLTSQISTVDGEGICTRDGAEIHVWKAEIRDAVSSRQMRKEIVQASEILQRMVEEARSSCMAAVEALAGAIVAGRVSTPLTARNGAELLTRYGAQISAVRNTKFL